MAINLTDALGQPAAPEAAPVPEAPAAPEEGGIPPAVLEIPEMSALLAGTPPATWVERGDESPEVQVVMQNKDALMDAGFGLFGSNDGQTVVFFNGHYVQPEELQAADKLGKLRQFAVPFSELKASLSGATSGAALEAPSAPPSASAAPPGAGFEKKLATRRMKNLAVGSPTSGPSPGAGRILNSIMAPVV